MNVLNVIIQSLGEPHRRYRISEQQRKESSRAASSRRMQQRYDEKSIFKILSRDATWKGSSEMNGYMVGLHRRRRDWLIHGFIFP